MSLPLLQRARTAFLGRRSRADAPRAPRAPGGDVLTRGAPHVRAPRDAGDVYGAWVIAVVPCALLGAWNVGRLANLAAEPTGWRVDLLGRVGLGLDATRPLDCLARGALYVVPLFLVALAVGALWEQGFARLRGRALLPGLSAMAALFALLVAPTLPLWQAALGMSFGVVLGKEIFGGTGMHVLHPVVVGLALLTASYPASTSGSPAFDAAGGATLLQLASTGGREALAERGVSWARAFAGAVPAGAVGTSALGCLLGAAWLCVTRVVSWRVIVGAALGMTVSALALGGVAPRWQLVLGGFAFGAVFLATDGASGAFTRAGRWLHGLFFGFLVALIRTAGPGHPDGTIPALLLASVFAPLIDRAVLRAHAWRRARRRGALP